MAHPKVEYGFLQGIGVKLVYRNRDLHETCFGLRAGIHNCYNMLFMASADRDGTIERSPYLVSVSIMLIISCFSFCIQLVAKSAFNYS